tara:strand:+ start:22 stop:450 length:429 start_codon:yes stop_codon:yes gene_type:complete
MANIVPNAFKGELLSGTHNFASGGNQFKLALYTSNPYSTSSTAYLTSNEVSSGGSSGYTTTGLVLQNQAVTTGATSFVDFDDLTFSSVTFSAAFGAIYNDTNSDKLCVVLDFGGTKTATNGDFKIVFPPTGTPGNAIISLTS